MSDALFPHSVTPSRKSCSTPVRREDLHILLGSPGGDGETAVRLVRQAHSRSKTLTVIVPDQAKSAGTLFALGAHRIIMGPTSDLGPIDPQFLLGNGSLVAAKAIIAAVDEAEKRIQANPATYPLHASLVADVTGILVQQARDSLARTDDLLLAALSCVPDRSRSDVATLARALKEPLIKQTKSHAAIISSEDAHGFGLPVEKADPTGDHWQTIWRLWTKYAILNAVRIYEGRTASFVIRVPESGQ